MGLRPTKKDEKRLPSGNYRSWKRRPPLCHPEWSWAFGPPKKMKNGPSGNCASWKRHPLLCHPERSRGICSSAPPASNLNGKQYPPPCHPDRSEAKWRDLLLPSLSRTNAQYDLSYNMSFFDPPMRLDHVVERISLGLERNRPRADRRI